jgi:hypothetical protein
MASMTRTVATCLEIYILDSGNPDWAVALARFGPDIGIERIPCRLVKSMGDFCDRLRDAAAGRGIRPSADELREYGDRLFSFVINSRLSAIYVRMPPHSVSIQVVSNRPDIQALPWEYLREPGRPPGPQSTRSIVRVIPSIGTPVPGIRSLRNRIRVLYVYADPVDQQPVSWNDILATIQREFSSRLPGLLDLDVIEGADIESLTRSIQSKRYDVLHFHGHGSTSGNLFLVDRRTRQSRPVSAAQLAVLLDGRGVQLVILSSCNSSAGDFSRPYAVVAQSLVESGAVPAVVANQFPVTNSVAATFCSGLYRTLLRTGDIDLAVAEGRVVLFMQNSVGAAASFEWGIPTLYRHVGAQQVFKP